jgi:DNA-binding LytR/AlgR family response regulator
LFNNLNKIAKFVLMNCIIVGDKINSAILEEFVLKSFSLTLVGTYNDAESVRDQLSRKNNIDLVFLDTEIPELDVFNFISSLDYQPNIIMVSSGYQDALKAFDFNVVDYLLKPVPYSRFCKAVDKAIRFYSRKEVSSSSDSEVFIKKGSSLVKLKLEDVIYIESLENYVTLFTKDEKFTIHFTLKSIENQLPPRMFIRVHRSFIVNKSMIQAIKENSLDIIIHNEAKSIPIGNSFRESLLKGINLMAK